MKVMRHGKKGSKGGDMTETSHRILVSLCVSMNYYSVTFILEFKVVVIIKLFCKQ